MSETSQIFVSSARAVALPSSDELMKRAKKAAFDPTVFDEHPPVFWRAEISNNSLDSFGTRMAKSSLKNYAKEAKEGRSFQNSHRTDDIGLGYSFGGEYADEEGGKTLADFYTITGLPDTDVFVAKMRAGIARDVSIGFYGGRWVCSICGGDMMDWRSCPHIPLVTYELDGNGQKRTEVATADVEDAHLSETSSAYDGATDGAEIIALMKAEREIKEGRLKPTAVRFLEKRYRINLPPARVSVSGTGERDMRKENEEPKTEEQPVQVRVMTDVRAALKTRGVADEAMPADFRAVMDAASDGLTYRADLIQAALDEGVRAYGDKFDRAGYELDLRVASIQSIKRMKDDWTRAADAIFKGGRKTQDEGNPPPDTSATNFTPAGAFMG